MAFVLEISSLTTAYDRIEEPCYVDCSQHMKLRLQKIQNGFNFRSQCDIILFILVQFGKLNIVYVLGKFSVFIHVLMNACCQYLSFTFSFSFMKI